MNLATDTERSIDHATLAEPVTFPADGGRLVGILYRPVAAGNAQLPAVVVTGTWTSVKEQMADRYAERLARRGLAALSFDFSGFGLSGGEPREVESASLKARDIRNAVAYLRARDGVDPRRIGVLAICASAMYAGLAAAEDSRICALALIAPWLHDRALVNTVYGGELGVAEKLRATDAASSHYEQTGVVDYVPVADPDDPRAAMPMAIDFYADPARGRLPGWPNRFAVMAWREWLTFDAIALAPRLQVPTLVVHSQDAAIPDGARRFYDGLQCGKQIAWLTGTQFDFYDQPDTVDAATERAAAHFAVHLGRPVVPSEKGPRS